MIKKLLSFHSLVLVLSLSGCAKQCIQMPYGSDINSTPLRTSNGILSINSPGSDLSSGNLLRGKLVILNNSDKAQSAKYQFQWLDAKGFPVGENIPWQPVVISPRSSQVISDVAPDASANRYTVRVCN